MAAALAGALFLAGCGWFGGGDGGQPDPAVEEDAVNPLIPRRNAIALLAGEETEYAGTPVTEITDLTLERRPGGALLVATGRSASANPFDIRLTRNEDADPDVLAFTLEAIQPPSRQGGGKTLRAGVFLSDQDLAAARTIRVQGASGARAIGR